MGKKHKALVWGSIKLWKKESFIMERAAKIRRQTRKQKRSYHFSSFKWDQTVICLCLPPPFWADADIISTDCIAFDGKKQKHVFFNCNSSAIIYNSMFVDFLTTLCVAVWEREERWRLHIHNVLSSAPRFSERILTVCVIKGTDSIALYDPVNLIPQHVHFTEPAYTCTHKLGQCDEEGGIFKNTN